MMGRLTILRLIPPIALALVVGCATPREKEYQVVTEILSEPPGARIEVNGNYVGDAPVSTRIRHHPSDNVVMGKVIIRALPRSEGEFVQEKVFQGPQYPFDPHRDVVPTRILFLMTLPPTGAPTTP